MNPKRILKTAVRSVFLVVMFPCALLAGFGRIEALFTLWAHVCAQVPGLLGDYIRAAYYHLTLDACPTGSRICFGTFFSSTQVRLEDNVYIGAYCIIGRAHIGARAQIASSVHILSGRHHHPRDAEGRILGAEHGTAAQILIGHDCWIGEGAIVMADIGAGSTIGAGAVVAKEIPPNVVAVGNPAKVIKAASVPE